MHGWRAGGSTTFTRGIRNFTSLGTCRRARTLDMSDHAITLHASVLSGDDVIQRFWEIEERVPSTPIMSEEERHAVKYFDENHSRATDG